MSHGKTSRVLCLFGPTGVGKTALLSGFFPRGFEIVSADSMQVYTGMDIGTAKPACDILNQIPHHLISIRHPGEQFTVGDFVRLAKKRISEIEHRGNIPVVSGGTAFYFKHLLYGLPDAPPSKDSVRKELERLCDREGIPILLEKLARIDPVSAERIHSSDRYRIIRALEVYQLSGRPLSSFKRTSSHGLASTSDICLIGLFRDREELKERIKQRVDSMFSEGLVDEVRTLISQGAKQDWPGMKGIGYREFFSARESGELSYRDVRRMIQKNSIKYAKRQMTFFSSLPEVNWLHPGDTRKLVSQCRAFFD
ncbi:MAG: tRNA (adenosine(37)-N6)-dimethylallyltransferase MiaA [Spirochaetales bacterium]|jgi:tRNA dimethylallyltransferase|nr:tRNA (adenosine(37)-N6)-dimethylallyltransferase MiaA [Spirochaetales bacterium]